MHKKRCGMTVLLCLMSVTMGGCAANTASYQSGYDKGYNAGYQDGIKQLSPEYKSVTVYGDFTATVREVIPDYVYDGVTPRAAVVTLFQDGPFVLQLNETMCQEIEAGETYAFLIDEQEVLLPDSELYEGGEVSWKALAVRNISVTDFRTPVEEEYGLSSWRVRYTGDQ